MRRMNDTGYVGDRGKEGEEGKKERREGRKGKKEEFELIEEDCAPGQLFYHTALQRFLSKDWRTSVSRRSNGFSC